MTRNVTIARKLRCGQTDAERKLWFRLRDRRLSGLKFRRQMPLGRYVVDWESSRLIIELDGGQHAEALEKDALRTREIEAMGHLVLRFWNNEVLTNTDGVLESILSTLDKLNAVPPHPNPLPTQVGLARLANDNAELGQARVRWEREYT